MTNFSYHVLQQAIYQKLTGDSALMALISGVYDHVPQDTAYPYIVIGECSISDRSTKTSIGTENQVKLHVWSREGGRKQSASIMERIYQLLHQGTMTVTGHAFILSHFQSSQLTLEDDGWTYQGVMQFSMILQSN